jgi:hypothetical protein
MVRRHWCQLHNTDTVGTSIRSGNSSSTLDAHQAPLSSCVAADIWRGVCVSAWAPPHHPPYTLWGAVWRWADAVEGRGDWGVSWRGRTPQALARVRPRQPLGGLAVGMLSRSAADPAVGRRDRIITPRAQTRRIAVAALFGAPPNGRTALETPNSRRPVCNRQRRHAAARAQARFTWGGCCGHAP